MAKITKKEQKEKDRIWNEYLEECKEEIRKENKMKEMVR